MQKKKKYKMISVNYTNECAKKPRCSFCYLLKERKVNKSLKRDFELAKGGSIFFPFSVKASKLIASTEQVAIAYNGVDTQKLLAIFKDCDYLNNQIIINLTTNPDFVTPHLAALWNNYKVRMVALSLDSEKCKKGFKSWIRAAELLKNQGIKVGANILMLDEVFGQISKILKLVSPFSYQIHLLRPKFYKTKISKKKRLTMLFLLKSQYPNLFIDQCFRFELQGIPCTRGQDFFSVNADGSISLCSFDLYRDNIKNLKKCPYISDNGKEKT